MSEIRSLPRTSAFVASGRAFLLTRSRDAVAGSHVALATSPARTLCGFTAGARVRVPRPGPASVDCVVCQTRLEVS